jgi:DNA-binding response OmpR family regulator
MRVLLVEDNYLLASALQEAMEQMGAEVLGPYAHVAPALVGLDAAAQVDAGLLDINLGNEQSFPIADALAQRGVPTVLLTGYDTAALPAPYRELPCLQKPVNLAAMLAALAGLGIGAPSGVPPPHDQSARH